MIHLARVANFMVIFSASYFKPKTNYFEPDIEPNIKPDRADLGIRFYDILIQEVAITKTPWTGEYRDIHPCI